MAAAPLPWSELTESAREAVVHLVELLAERFTGHLIIDLDCSQGGVRSITETRVRKVTEPPPGCAALR